MKISDYDFLESKFLIKEYNNLHISKDADKVMIEKMRKYRKLIYGDEYIYGKPDIHSETKDGTHLDK